MAKRQNFIVGSTNPVTESLTDAQLDSAFDQYEILTADKLDGVFNAVSDYSNDSSNEIANAIKSITGSDPSGNSENELADALQQMRNEILTSSLTFVGYVATSAPDPNTYELKEDNLWINYATMPTSFPIAANLIKKWDGSAWVNYGDTYTPNDFEAFRNLNDGQGYYWFGGQWVVMSTDLSTDYFYLNPNTGKWEISSTYNNTLVHKAGTEDITGSKTFTSDINRKFNTTIDGSNHYNTAIVCKDSGGTSTGYFRNIYTAENSNAVSMLAYRVINGESFYGEVRACVAADGTTYATAPLFSSSSSTSSNVIATVGWVNDYQKSTNVVHRDSSETITGSKTFTSTINASFSSQYPNGFLAKNTLIPTNYNNPANDVTVAVNGLIANDGTFVAYEQMGKTAVGVTSASLNVRNRASSSSPNRNASIGVSIDSTGNITTYAPSCDTNGSIVITVNKNKGSNGYFKLGNGLIVQWGVIPSEAPNTLGSVSLPTAFSTTNYSVFIGFTTAVSNGYGVYSYDYETTKFKYNTQTYAPVGYNSEKRWIAIGY